MFTVIRMRPKYDQHTEGCFARHCATHSLWPCILEVVLCWLCDIAYTPLEIRICNDVVFSFCCQSQMQVSTELGGSNPVVYTFRLRLLVRSTNANAAVNAHAEARSVLRCRDKKLAADSAFVDEPSAVPSTVGAATLRSARDVCRWIRAPS